MNLPNFLKGNPMASETSSNSKSPTVVPRAPIEGQAYAPPRFRSQAYAQAQAEWDSLENELAYIKDQCESLRAQVKVGEETIKALKLERDDLRTNNERLVRENTDMHASITAAANCLVGLMAKRNADPRADATEAVAAALATASAHSYSEPHQ